MSGVRVGQRAPETKLLDADGREVDVLASTAGKPTVMFFLRHYG